MNLITKINMFWRQNRCQTETFVSYSAKCLNNTYIISIIYLDVIIIPCLYEINSLSEFQCFNVCHVFQVLNIYFTHKFIIIHHFGQIIMNQSRRPRRSHTKPNVEWFINYVVNRKDNEKYIS